MTTPPQKQSEPESFTLTYPFTEAINAIRNEKDNPFRIDLLLELHKKINDAANYPRAQPSETPVAEKVREFEKFLLADENSNGGFVNDLCFTVWKLCHETTERPDGNTDWFNDTLPTVLKGNEVIRKNLALLDQQAAPVEDGEKEIDLSGLMAGTHKVVPVEHDLTELKAAVEGMRKPIPKPVITAFEQRNLWDEGHNTALSAVADKIDEMIRRG